MARRKKRPGGARLKRGFSGPVGPQDAALRDAAAKEDQIDKTAKELAKLADESKKAGDGMGKFGQSIQSFLLSPLTSNVQQVLGGIANVSSGILGASAQSLGIPGAGMLRGFAGDISATDTTGQQLAGIADVFGQRGIALDAKTAEAMRARLQGRNQLSQANQRVAANVQQEFVSDRMAEAGIDAANGVSEGVGLLKKMVRGPTIDDAFDLYHRLLRDDKAQVPK